VGIAIDTVSIANAMDVRGMLYEAYALTVEVITMAATVLLFVETCAPGDELAARAWASSSQARVLLEILARQNCAAARCLESLNVSQARSTSNSSLQHDAISLREVALQLTDTSPAAPLHQSRRRFGCRFEFPTVPTSTSTSAYAGPASVPASPASARVSLHRHTGLCDDAGPGLGFLPRQLQRRASDLRPD